MDYNQVIKLQKKFSRYHIFLFAFLVVFTLEHYSHNLDIIIIRALYIIIPMFIIDFIFYYKNFFENYKLIVIDRFILIVGATYFLLYSNYTYSVMISIVCLTLFDIEFATLYDLTDSYEKTVAILGSIIPLILMSFIHIFFYSSSEKLFSLIFAVIIIITINIIIIIFSSNAIETLEEKMLQQKRIINNTNQINEDLRDNQEKLKKANELLGLQKIKLEDANNEINRVNSEIIIQNDIIKYISSSLNISKLMELVTEALLKEMELDISVIIIDKNIFDNEEISYNIKTRFLKDFENFLKDKIEEGYFSQYKEMFIDNNVQINKYPFLKGVGTSSILIAPLIKSDKKIGTLFVGHKNCDYFIENKSFFEAVVSQFLIALNNANLYKQMEDMARKDGLTNIYNRGYLISLFQKYSSETVANNQNFTVALLDIDRFKLVNDTYGHPFGDVVIKTIAQLASKKMKKCGGVVGRYGGEEFVMLFPNKDITKSYEIIKELHEEIKNKELYHNDKSVHVNVSIGITSYPMICKNTDELLRRADKAMYYSKENGRGKIIIDSEEIRELVKIK